MKRSSPLVCDMNALTPAQREAHSAATGELMRMLVEIEEVENGFLFTFPNETALISRIAEFIALERLCCPFLEFGMQIRPGSSPLVMEIEGPVGTRQFLRSEFEGAFS